VEADATRSPSTPASRASARIPAPIACALALPQARSLSPIVTTNKGGDARTPHGADDHPHATMSDEERAKVRRVGAEDARHSGTHQELPERIEDPAVVAVLTSLLRAARAPEPKESTRRYERNPVA
jgi:hypothetical protein